MLEAGRHVWTHMRLSAIAGRDGNGKSAFRRSLGAVHSASVALLSVAMLVGCGGGGNSDSASSSSGTTSSVSVTTGSLPTGQVGVVYSATLAASGGTAPYTWSLTKGTLPAGLSLKGATGAITGTPTATSTGTSLTFQVADSTSPAQVKSATLSIVISASAIAVTVSPARAGVTVTQPISVTASINDAAGVTWSIKPSGGSFSSTSSLTGVGVTLTSPATPGVYTVTARSITDSSKSASFVLGVTDLAGVYTYHSDQARDGANLQEYALTTANVRTSFGKLFSCTVDGAIYAQPLWVANLRINGASHNVVFVATQHDSLYAFDADTRPCLQLWSASLIDTGHGGVGDETSVPSSGVAGSPIGQGAGDIFPELGVTGTPVIDPNTGILYVVSKSVDPSTSIIYQRIHAIDVTTGNEMVGSPSTITVTNYPGTGDGGTMVAFNATQENQRAGLALVNGSVYITWASHEDTLPFYGWIVAYTYNAGVLTQSLVWNVAPNTGGGGIWMSGGAPAVDANNNIYLITSNAEFDATNATSPNDDYGDSLLEFNPSLSLQQYFTPSDQASDYTYDNDFGAGGAGVLVDLPAGSPVSHLVIGGGKDKSLYVLNRDLLGGLGDSNAWQQIAFNAPIFATGAYWNGNFYLAGVGGPLTAYSLTASTGKFSLGTTSSQIFGFPGTSPSVSALGNSNGIVWALDNSKYCTPQSPDCGPAVLHAYDATNLQTEIWNSSTAPADAAGYAVKFVVPTVANGKVYVGTRGNNTGGFFGSTTVSGEVDVYGLKSN